MYYYWMYGLIQLDLEYAQNSDKGRNLKYIPLNLYTLAV